MGRRGRQLLKEERTFFVTTSVFGFHPVFADKACCDLLLRNIKYYRDKHRFAIIGYVIMPTHFHWIIHRECYGGSVSDIMRDIKKYSAWDILDYLEEHNETDLVEFFMKAAAGTKDQNRRFWQKRFDDKVIRDRNMLSRVLTYVHNNPVKAGLVSSPEEYQYSSARNYILGDHSILDVLTEW